METTEEILNGIPVACYRLNENSVITYVNRHAETLFNKGKETLVNRNVWDVFPGSRSTRCFTAINGALEAKKMATYDYISAVTHTWIRLTATPVGKGVVVSFIDISDLKQAEQQMNRKNRQLQMERGKLKERQRMELLANTLNTQEEERKRIAENLHNGLGQLLYSIQLNFNQLNLKPGEIWNDRHDGIWKATMELIILAIKESRRISHELIPTVLEDFGLREAIEDLCRQFTGAMNIQCSFGKLPRKIAQYIEIALYRTTQELIANSIRHAKASKVSVVLGYENDVYELIVTDNGKGFDTAQRSEGIGLMAIKNKIDLLNGVFEISSGTGGTTARIAIPGRI